jgi:hypothetical protein
MITTITNPTALQSFSFGDFARKTGFSLPKEYVEKSKENGYPMLTVLHNTEKFTKPDGTLGPKALVLFFSKSCTKKGLVTIGDLVDNEYMQDFQVSWVTCNKAEGGFAWKIVPKGVSTYVDASDWD